MQPQGAVGPDSDAAEVVGRRIGAALLDLVLLAIAFVIAGVLSGGGDTSDGRASVNLEGAAALAYFAIVIGYYIGTEVAWGATVGKRMLGLRVVLREGGGRPGTGQIVVRNLLRIVDSLPFLYLLGLVVMLVTPGKQRIGDLAAGTTVVAGQARTG